MNMNKYQKTRSQMVIESVVRFGDFVDDVMDHFEYDNLLFPKNLLLLLGMNEVNGYRKNGEFAHFTKQDNFLQYSTAIVLGNPKTIYITLDRRGEVVPLESVIDEVQKGQLYIPDFEDDYSSVFGHLCTVSIIRRISFEMARKNGDTAKITHSVPVCAISRFTNYHDNESYYSDDHLAKLYRTLSGDQLNTIPARTIDELQRELSTMCDFITR